jgi:hypothetical protein
MPTIKEEMSALDRRNFAWYDGLSAEDQKKLSMWVVMRYASSTSSKVTEINEHYLTVINDFVNVGFNDLRHYPEFQWRLMQLAGINKEQFHSWIPPMKKKKSKNAVNDALITFYAELNPFLNSDELGILLTHKTKDEIKDELEAHGLTAKKIKEMMK